MPCGISATVAGTSKQSANNLHLAIANAQNLRILLIIEQREMDMKLGTATIQTGIATTGQQIFIVRWMNTGNFLHNEPRGFWTKEEALKFCTEIGVRVR